MSLRLLLFFGCLLLSVSSSSAGDTVQFPFLTPWDDARANFVDVSGLNDGPAGSHGFIVVKEGHFVESDTGRRVRFLGTNLGLDGLFPSHEDAEKLVAHLAKYGINVVRLHHQDNTFDWAGPQGRLWDRKYPDHRHFDAGQLDKMDYLAAQLEKHGIYIDMCLHVSRTLTRADGFPAGVEKIPFPFDKRVDIFDPQMAAIDKEYFHDLLTHVNPYTGKSYASDPGLLNVEINNENSLMGLYGETPGADLTGLPDPYGRELSDLWNDWLIKKYGTTAKLAEAWKTPDHAPSPNLYPPSLDPAKWVLEYHAATPAKLTADEGGLRVDVSKVDGTDWHVQLYQKGLGLLKNGTAYTMTLDMKADRDGLREIGAHLDQPDYGDIGLSGKVQLTPQWETYTLWFTAKNAVDGHNRLPTIILGAAPGTTWIRNITLKEGVGGYTLPASETLEAKSVRIEPLGHFQARTDWLNFLADTEAAYVRSMRSYLRDDLGVKPLIICSQAAFGGLWGNYRETASDYVDHHAYWDYAERITDPIQNQPMVRALGNGDALTTLALERNAGLPTSVTEYNICFPNEYRAETLPGFASFAAFQDWDAIFLFAHDSYGAYGARIRANDRMMQSLETSVDPAIWSFMPSAALMFRGALIPTAPAVRTLGLPASFPAADVAGGLNVATAWQKAGEHALDPFSYRMQLGIGLPDAMPDTAAPKSVLTMQTASPATARYVADAPGAKVVFGFVGGQTVTLSGATFAFGPLTNQFGALTLVSMDGKPLATSSKMLLTVVTHTQNNHQAWNKTRTQVTRAGDAPPQVDAATVNVTIAADGPRSVVTLDGSGEKQQDIPATYKDGQVSFSITPAQKSVWYAISKVGNSNP